MKNFIIILFSFISVVANASVKTDFNKACAFYKNKNFDKALEEFKKLETKGFVGAELYYNIANCYYKHEDLGYAIAYYEKAKLLDPSDDEIKANLRLLNAKITDKIGSEEKGLTAWLKSVIYLLSADKLSFYGMVLWIAGFLGLVLILWKFMLKGKYYFIAMIITGTLLYVTGFIQFKMINNKSSAIIIASSLQVRTNPDTESKVVYNLHEGTKVNIHEISDGWCEISIDNENFGWIPTNDVIII